MVGLIVVAVVVALLGCVCFSYCCSTIKLRFDDAATRLFEYWDGNPDAAKDIPVKLQGVFWLATNPGNEVCFTWMASQHDIVKRRFTFYPGGGCCCKSCSSTNLWTYGTGFSGILLYLVNRIPVLRFTLDWDEDYQNGSMTILLFNCIPLSGSNLIKQDGTDSSGKTWFRTSTQGNGSVQEAGCYTIKKVIDEKGEKLPAFEEMVKSMVSRERFQGWLPKSIMTFIPLPLCSCCGSRSRTYDKVGLSEELKA